MTLAACHLHSEWSYDGRWTLAALAAELGRRGYGLLLMTEHDRGFSEARWQSYRAACAAASSSDVRVIPGIEYSDPANLMHVLVWGSPVFLGENVPTGDLLKRASERGAAAVLAHPSRRQAWKSFEPAWVPGLSGIEAWNRKTDGWAPSPSAAALLSQTGLAPFVGLDFHERRQLFPLAMELPLDGAATEAAVAACVRERRCRALFRGRPYGRAARGWSGRVWRSAEGCRRALAHARRRWLHAGAARRPQTAGQSS